MYLALRFMITTMSVLKILDFYIFFVETIFTLMLYQHNHLKALYHSYFIVYKCVCVCVHMCRYKCEYICTYMCIGMDGDKRKTSNAIPMCCVPFILRQGLSFEWSLPE